MRTFKLNSGDILIEENKMSYVEGLEMIKQTLTQVLATNIGEWEFDTTEGIDFDLILTKNPNFDLVRDTIETAVQKVADNFSIEIETDNYNFAVVGRTLTIDFVLKLKSTGESTTINISL